MKQDWSEYYNFMRKKQPYSLLVNALEYVEDKDSAIDIAGGALQDTRYLLEQGFNVLAIDNSPLLKKEAEKIRNSKLSTELISFEEFEFPQSKYDLASAMFALNFCNPNHFNSVFRKIIESLKPGGIFCAQLFGDLDEFSGYEDKTYPSKKHIRQLLEDMEIIYFKEKKPGEYDTNDELKKSGHILQFITKKNSEKAVE